METIFPFSTNYFYIKSFSLVGGNVFPSSGNHFSANIYLLKSAIETLQKGVKYIQS